MKISAFFEHEVGEYVMFFSLTLKLAKVNNLHASRSAAFAGKENVMAHS